MTKDNNKWGNEWPSQHTGEAIAERQKQAGNIGLPEDGKVTEALNKLIKENWPVPDDWQKDAKTYIGWDKGNNDITTIVKMKKDLNSGIIRVKDIAELKSQGSNLVDTECYLYFQCEGCGAILDPHTKSFATLQENRVDAGWACKWNIDGMGYKVYCAECGEKAKCG